jgi:hypothetical protein
MSETNDASVGDVCAGIFALCGGESRGTAVRGPASELVLPTT